MRVLKDNVGDYLHDVGIGKDFLDYMKLLLSSKDIFFIAQTGMILEGKRT